MGLFSPLICRFDRYCGSRQIKKTVPGALKTLDLQTKSAAIYDGSALVLSRPDQHVVWRNNLLPANPLALIDRVRGAAGQ